MTQKYKKSEIEQKIYVINERVKSTIIWLSNHSIQYKEQLNMKH